MRGVARVRLSLCLNLLFTGAADASNASIGLGRANMFRKWIFGALAGLTLLATSAVQAGVIYDYTGNAFTTAISPHSLSDSVTGWIEFTTAPGLGDAVTSVMSFSFSDGVQTIDSASAGPAAFRFEFDSTLPDTIINWAVLVQATSSAVPYILSCKLPTQSVSISGGIGCGTAAYEDAGQSGANIFGVVSDNGGSWIRRTPDGSVPTPSTLYLSLAGLAAFGFMRRKKRR